MVVNFLATLFFALMALTGAGLLVLVSYVWLQAEPDWECPTLVIEIGAILFAVGLIGFVGAAGNSPCPV